MHGPEVGFVPVIMVRENGDEAKDHEHDACGVPQVAHPPVDHLVEGECSEREQTCFLGFVHVFF